MNNKIILLLNYKGHFTSKWIAKPYQSGMNLKILKEEFNKYQIEIECLRFSDINLRKRNYEGEKIIYTSSEDQYLQYKSYVEDILYALELQGATLIPKFQFLKAHHNKVFMELLRDLSLNEGIKNIQSNHFGTLEDFIYQSDSIKYPKVFKGASGAVSSSVRMVRSKKEAIETIKKLSRTKSLFLELWDFGRFLKHKGYTRDSLYRKKFVLQNFIANMNNDWKVIVFGQKYYVLERGTRKSDFRASGSGIISYNRNLPDGMLDYAKGIFESFKLPFLAMDIGYDGLNFCLIEFQAINFGTHTVDTAPFYFIKKDNKWEINEDKTIVEKEFVVSIVDFINKNE